jgi:hypothetical protein
MQPPKFLVAVYLLLVGSAFALRAGTRHAAGLTATDARDLNQRRTTLSQRAPPIHVAKTRVRTRPKRTKGWSGKRDKKQKPPKKPAPAPGPPSKDLLRGGVSLLQPIQSRYWATADSSVLEMRESAWG